MVEEKIGGRPVTITKKDGNIKVVFHPMAKGVKHPKANAFTITLSKTDIEALKRAF